MVAFHGSGSLGFGNFLHLAQGVLLSRAQGQRYSVLKHIDKIEFLLQVTSQGLTGVRVLYMVTLCYSASYTSKRRYYSGQSR